MNKKHPQNVFSPTSVCNVVQFWALGRPRGGKGRQCFSSSDMVPFAHNKARGHKSLLLKQENIEGSIHISVKGHGRRDINDVFCLSFCGVAFWCLHTEALLVRQ